MRIGILTFHRAHNYGAVLQAYALQEFLKTCGHEALILDYRQPFIEKIYKCFSIRRCLSKNPFSMLVKTAQEIRSYKLKKLKKIKFESFNQIYLSLSQPIHNAKEIPNNYDIYIHGSDQIWNSKLVGKYDLIYFGAYVTSNKSIKLSYAASMELKDLSTTDTDSLKKGLALLDYISVRESKLIDFLQPLTSKPIINTIDPTLLAPSNIWEKMYNKPMHNKRYILTYQVGKYTNVDEQAQILSKIIGIKILSINKMNLSPDDFVLYIKHAECIISDSFHATVFSLLLHKDFYTIATGTGSDIRFTGLLTSLGLEDRILSMPIKQHKTINYPAMRIDEKLEQYRRSSKEFILKAINHETI